METTKKAIALTAITENHKGEATCSRCNHLLKHPHEYLLGENGTIICESCYRELLCPQTKDYKTELLD